MMTYEFIVVIFRVALLSLNNITYGQNSWLIMNFKRKQNKYSEQLNIILFFLQFANKNYSHYRPYYKCNNCQEYQTNDGNESNNVDKIILDKAQVSSIVIQLLQRTVLGEEFHVFHEYLTSFIYVFHKFLAIPPSLGTADRLLEISLVQHCFDN